MRRLALVTVVVVLMPRPSAAQHFYDAFDAPSSAAFAEASDDWDNAWSGDAWTSARNVGGVCPVTDVSGPGSLGSPVDAFENLIVAGELGWRDYAVETSFYALDNDAVGVVLRYTSQQSFYLAVTSRHEMPSPTGSQILSAGETRLYRIHEGLAVLLASAPTSYTGQTAAVQRLRAEAAGKRLRVFLGLGGGAIDPTSTPVIDVEDEAPLSPTAGQAGLYAFAMGSGLAGTYFDTFRVSPMDSDKDGKTNDDELDAGTDPNDGDSDDDGVADGAEFRWSEDADKDGLINALDPDSDNDGLPDGLEQGLTEPHADTDVSVGDFIADADPSTRTNHLVADTDGGGALDGEEDVNRNGRVDKGERDPLNQKDDDNVIDTTTQNETESETATSDSDTLSAPDTETASESVSATDTGDSSDTGTPPSGEGAEGFYGGPDCACNLAQPPMRRVGLLAWLLFVLAGVRQ